MSVSRALPIRRFGAIAEFPHPPRSPARSGPLGLSPSRVLRMTPSDVGSYNIARPTPAPVPGAYSGEAEHPDRCIVNAPIGDRDRSGATLGDQSVVELPPFSTRTPCSTIPVRPPARPKAAGDDAPLAAVGATISRTPIPWYPPPRRRRRRGGREGQSSSLVSLRREGPLSTRRCAL
jgi:hypothetical protein